MSDTQSWSNIARAFGNRHYRTYQFGRFVAQMTVWMYRVAIGWTVWRLTHSATWLGVFGFLDQAPALLITPIAGAIADRSDCLKYIRVTQALLLAQAVALSLLDWFDMLPLPALAAFTLVYGAVTAAQQPASQAVLPNLLRREELTAAYGLNSVLFNVSRFAGPMLAGFLINAWGTAPAIFANAIGAAVFSACLMVLQTGLTIPRRAGGARSSVIKDMREGFAYAVKHPGIGPTMAFLSALSVMPFTIDLLLPSLADGVYHAGPRGLSWMTAVIGVGAMVQATLIARRGAVTGLTTYVIRSILALGIGFSALAFAGSIWLALACIFVIGFAASATRVGSMTLLQYSVDPVMRGRVASFYLLINQAGPAAASLMVGALGDCVGVPVVMGIIGAYTLAVWGWAAASRRAITLALETAPAANR